MFDLPKRWAQARMAPQTWERSRQSAIRLREGTNRTFAGFGHWLSVGGDHVTSMRSARFEPWRLVFATLLIATAAFLMYALGVRAYADVAVPMSVLFIAIGMSTYVADWVGGLAAIITAIAAIDLLFVGRVWKFDATAEVSSIISLLAFAVTATFVIMIIEHLKYDRATARLESAALRAANTALSAVEIAAARRPAGDRAAYVRVLESILTAMVRVNRASTGRLYLLDASSSTLVLAASYGEDDSTLFAEERDLADNIPIGEGFAGQIAQERRAITEYDSHLEPQWADIPAANPHVRAVAGVPLIGPNDLLVGVAWVGLYVSYRFAPTAIARLQGLAHRTIAFMEAARLSDDQDALLDRVQDNYRRLQSVIQTIPEAVMVARPPHGYIVASNAAAQRMFGIPAEGRTDARRVDQLNILPSAGSDGPLPIQRALEEGEVVTGVELQVRLPSGKTIPVVAGAAPLRTDDGVVDAVVAIFQDVGPLKEAERMRDEFISIVSHELRSPLTPIRGFAQVVARDLEREGNHPRQVEWLGTLQHHADRMTRLIDDLLDVSRLRAGRLKIRRAPADLVKLCQTVVASRSSASDRHPVVLRTDATSLVMEMDGDRILQVVDNLVVNATKYAGGGTITIDLKSVDGPNGLIGAILTVTDEGTGVPLEEQDHLFSPFFRSRAASDGAVPGLGLGLYICRELVEAHDGTIQVSSSPEGGARFTILLPPS